MCLPRLIPVISVWLWSAGMPSLATSSSADDGAAPAVVCRFELSVTSAAGHPPRRQTWLFWREPARVETRTADGGELWWRDARGVVYYQRLFHQQRRLIEYTPVDLRALGAIPNWARLAHLIDPKLLGAELKRIASTTALGRPAVRYRGDVRGVRHEILWLTQEQLPARMRLRHGERTVTIWLKEIHPIERSRWPRANTDTYVVTDYADIGDDEADPFLRRLLNEAGPAHAH